jgi:hypothetical protein
MAKSVKEPRMAKVTSTPITAADLREYAAAQDDFGFELEVYRKARELNLSPSHAGTYEDPVTNKARQYDIRAVAVNGNFRIRLAIECKSLSNLFPLLISRVPRSEEESFHDLTYTLASPDNVYTGCAAVMPVRGPTSLYRPADRVGKSMRQVKRNDDGRLAGGDDIFDKWMQALASADGLIKQALDEHRPRRNEPMFTCVLPILVVSDCTLWVADYSHAGQLEGDPVQVEEVTFFLGRTFKDFNPSLNYTVSHLHIQTRSKIGDFLAEVSRPGALWERIFLA